MNIGPVTNSNAGLSVVIATLGGNCLIKTIDSLLTGSMKPDEILVCIPDERESQVVELANDVVKVVLTGVKGQVKQRAVGFQRSAGSLVLQLDDDIILETDTIKNLVTHIQQLGKGNVIAPAYYGIQSRKCIHELQNGFIKNLFDVIVCASNWGVKKMGTVTSIGINYGVDDSLCKNELVKTQWLSGGCVLSYKEDLVTDNFFPFEGKAYCEDVYHSYYRTLAGTKMWVAAKEKVFIDQPEPEFSKAAVEKVIKIRRQYLEIIHGPQWRLSLYELFSRIRSKLYAGK
jgi:glycosyltransferase involved in cell wall biosynthesis